VQDIALFFLRPIFGKVIALKALISRSKFNWLSVKIQMVSLYKVLLKFHVYGVGVWEHLKINT
jgi:hypothetical protein